MYTLRQGCIHGGARSERPEGKIGPSSSYFVDRAGNYGKQPGRGRAVIPIFLGACARAAADVWIYALLPIYLHVRLDESRLWLVSLVLTAPALVRWVMAPIWGRAADESPNPRLLMAVGLLGYGGLLLGLSFIDHPVGLIAFVAASTAFGSAFNPVARTWVSRLDPQQAIVHLASWHQWEAAGYLLAGLLLGGALHDADAFTTWTAGTAALLIVCSLWLWALGPPTEARPHRRPSSLETSLFPSRRGRRFGPRPSFLSVDPTWRRALLFLFVASVVWEAVAGVFGLYFTQTVGGSVTTYGFVISASTGLSLLVYQPLARWGQRAAAARLFGVAAVSATIMYAFMAVPSPWFVAASYMVPFTSIVRTAFNALLVHTVAVRRRGEFLGAMEATESSAAVLGPVVGGAGADRFGLQCIPVFALCASAALYFLVTKPRHRRIA